MGRTLAFCLLLTTGLSACMGDMGDRVDDPSPHATLSDDLNEPTDGFENEVGTED